MKGFLMKANYNFAWDMGVVLVRSQHAFGCLDPLVNGTEINDLAWLIFCCAL